MNEAMVLHNTLELGKDVIAFLDTRVGRYLIEQQQRDEREAVEALLAFDPYAFDTHSKLLVALLKLQENATLARKVNGYLHDAILNANQAEALIDNQEE